MIVAKPGNLKERTGTPLFVPGILRSENASPILLLMSSEIVRSVRVGGTTLAKLEGRDASPRSSIVRDTNAGGRGGHS